MAKGDKVRDGYLRDLPEDIQNTVINISKIVRDKIDELVEDPNYADLKSSGWAMSCIDEFKTVPSVNSQVGSIRVFQKKTRDKKVSYECMIQLTGHFRNHQYGWVEEQLHELIKRAYMETKSTIRKKYNMTIKNEGDMGNPDEGFDVYPDKKVAEEMWNKLEDRKTKTVIENHIEIEDCTGEFIFERWYIPELSDELVNYYENFYGKISYDEYFQERCNGNLGTGLLLNNINNAYITIYRSISENVDLYNEGRRLDAIKANISNSFNKIIDWIKRCVIYMKDSVIRLWNVTRAERMQRAMEKTLQHEGWAINFDDLPGDVYEDGFFESSYKTFYETNDISSNVAIFAKNVIKNKKLIITTACKFIPGVSTVVIARNVTKLLGTLMPACIDFIAATKEIALLQKKYNGMTRSIKDPNGRTIIEIPASEYIRIDKYQQLVTKIINMLVYDNKKQIEFSITSTDDLIKFFQGLNTTCKTISSEYTERLWSDYYQYKDEICSNINMSDDEKNRSLEARFKNVMDNLSSDKTAMMLLFQMMPLLCDSMFSLLNIYDKKSGVMYKISNRDMADIIIPLSNKLINTAMNICKDLDDLRSKGELSLLTVNKIIEKLGPHIADATNYTIDAAKKAGDITLIDKNGGYKKLESAGIYIHDKYAGSPIKETTNTTSLPDYNKEYNTEMTEKQAKSTLRTLSQSIINNNKEGEMGKGKNKVSQYTANIYANIITKNLLPKWAPGYKKFSITLDSYQSFFTFEFKTPTMSQDFISRFVDGREPISGFLHRIPEIKVRMSPRIFHTMENPDDAFFFFKSAIQYYDAKVEKYCKGLMAEVLKMNRSMKHLISTTKLSGLVTLPMSLLFIFDDAHMNNKNTFELSQEDINAVNQFMKNIYTRYAAPEKEKKKIVDDVKEMVKDLRESCDESETIRGLYYLPEAVEKYLNGDFDNEMQLAKEKFEYEQIDFKSMRNPVSSEVKYYQEKFGVKKLKKIPTDLVAYISIETEAIKDANDKMMIASYCLGKIEIVEWYIELLEVGSKKYIVPHNKPYLENVRTQLLACFKKIMATPIPKNDRPLIDVQYPKGYEG